MRVDTATSLTPPRDRFGQLSTERPAPYRSSLNRVHLLSRRSPTKVIEDGARRVDRRQPDLATFGVEECLIGGIQRHFRYHGAILIDLNLARCQSSRAQLVTVREGYR